MKDIKLIKFIKQNSSMLKKIGITFVIPITLSITGSIIFLSAGWNLISQSYALGSALFTNANTNLNQVTFNINNQEVGRLDIGHHAGSILTEKNGKFVIASHIDIVSKKLEGIKESDQIFIETGSVN